MTFVRYEALDDARIRLHLLCADPGPGEQNDYEVVITVTEWTAATTNAQRRTLVQDKLNHKYRALPFGTTMNTLVGNTFTV
jgi:hypothetical protein